MGEIIVAPNSESLARLAAENVIEIANMAITRSGRFLFVLSGGSTPKILYRMLGSEEFRHEIDWTKVCFFFGDERWVAPDSPDSNYRMARECLFLPLEIGPQSVIRWETEGLTPDESATRYEKAVRRIVGTDGQSGFDLILLGLGTDGHTVSLFPGSPVLHETARVAVTTNVPATGDVRLTLTLPSINAAANAFFLVSGNSKAETLRRVLDRVTAAGSALPAALIDPLHGDLKWFVDDDAASLLDLRKIGKFRVTTYN